MLRETSPTPPGPLRSNATRGAALRVTPNFRSSRTRLHARKTPPLRRRRCSAAKALRRRKKKGAASCSQDRRCPGMSPPDASGSSKANKSFPAECPCRALLALCPPTASTFSGPRTAETSAAQVPRFSAPCRAQASPGAIPRLSLPSDAAPRLCRGSAIPQRPRISAPFSAAPYRPRRRTLRVIPAAPLPPFPISPPPRALFPKPPPLRIASQAFFLYIPSQGKSSLSIFS